MVLEHLARPRPIGVRIGILLSLIGAGLIAVWLVELVPGDLVPNAGGVATAGKFFSRAFSPALHSEARFVPADAPALLTVVLQATWTTVLTGAAAMSLSLVLGLLLGFAASSAWWSGPGIDGGAGILGFFRRSVAPVICGLSRLLIIGMRSIHELMWAVLFLAAIGLNNLAAVIAIAIPYAGTLAKMFSELVDEAPREGAHSLRGLGATGIQTY